MSRGPYLLDTHTFLWWLGDDAALPPSTREVMADPGNTLFVSAATGWEIAIKQALGKLEAPENLATWLDEEGMEELPVRFADGEQVGKLPFIHRDPFDRMLVAQAQARNLTILTRDNNIPRYDVRTFWE